MYNDTELYEWAHRYFGMIPDACKLPSDFSLSAELIKSKGALSDEMRKNLLWLRTLVEGDLTSYAKKRDQRRIHEKESNGTNVQTVF